MTNESTPNEETDLQKTVYADRDEDSPPQPSQLNGETRWWQTVGKSLCRVIPRSKVGATLKRVVLPSRATDVQILLRLLVVSALVVGSTALGCGLPESSTNPLCTQISVVIASLL
tara:strand:- start:1877 stop:2221 length:345 start_codon:yes stop_codon:yes gene_type:complete